MKTLICILFLLMNLTLGFADDVKQQRETYQHVVDALKRGDFVQLKSYLILNPYQRVTYDQLEKNWSQAQPVYLKIFLPLNEVSIVKTIEGKNNSVYWILETNAVEYANKHLNAFKFIPDNSNQSGWKLLATKYLGAYTYPENMGIRDRVIKDMIKNIQSE